MTSVAEKRISLQATLLSLPGGAADGLIIFRTIAEGPECPTPSRVVIRAVHQETGEAILFKPACKTWGCPVCSEANKWRWMFRAVQGVAELTQQGIPLHFLTLTSHEKLDGPASFRVWPRAWNKLRARWRHHTPRIWRYYLAVPELHQDGRLHTHALIAGDLSERWWKDNARACGMGYMSDLEEVASLGVGKYVSKYLTKTVHDGWPKGKRRVNTTRNWPKLPRPSDLDGWTFSKVPQNRTIMAEIRDLQAAGYEIIMAQAKAAWALVDEISDQETG